MPDKDPTFAIVIKACTFPKLTLEQLIKKLRLMHDLDFTKYYTIVEDTAPDVPKEAPKC
jgi:hypothetical protein